MKKILFDVWFNDKAFIFGISIQFTLYPYDPDNKWINLYIGFLCWEFKISFKRK